MSDIVERLKSGTCGQGCGTMTECVCATAEDAADEITRLRAEVEDLGNRLHHVHRLWANNEHALRAENERLRAALQRVDDDHGYGLPPDTRSMIRAALEGKP